MGRCLLLAVFLEVLCRATILYELGSSGKHIWVLVESYWLNDICREQVHERLDLMHLLLHHFGYRVDLSETFQQRFSGEFARLNEDTS